MLPPSQCPSAGSGGRRRARSRLDALIPSLPEPPPAQMQWIIFMLLLFISSMEMLTQNRWKKQGTVCARLDRPAQVPRVAQGRGHNGDSDLLCQCRRCEAGRSREPVFPNPAPRGPLDTGCFPSRCMGRCWCRGMWRRQSPVPRQCQPCPRARERGNWHRGCLCKPRVG